MKKYGYDLLSLFLSVIIASTISATNAVEFKNNLDSFVLDSVAGGPSIFPKPKLDTIEVKSSGDIFIRIDTLGKGTTALYNIYENSVAPPNLLAQITSDQDSIVLSLGSALTNSKKVVIEAIDGCDANNRLASDVYSTFITFGTPGASCSGEYDLMWNAPTGFSDGIKGYRVYIDSTGNGYELVSTINDSSIRYATVPNIKRSTAYKLRVVAFDVNGAVNISAPHLYTSPSTLRNFTLVPPPMLRCTYVEDNGDVTLSWIPPKDTSLNFFAYEIQYREFGTTTWMDIVGNTDGLLAYSDVNFTVDLPGSGAQTKRYEFRMTTLAGCLGDTDGGYNTINSVFVEVAPRVGDFARRADISWNPAGVDYGIGSHFSLYKNSDSSVYGNQFYKKVINTTAIIDSLDLSCFGGRKNYHLSLIDSLFQSQGHTCEVRSNLATVTYNGLDLLFPARPIQYVSFDLETHGLNIYWDSSNPGDAEFVNFLTREGMTNGLINYRELIRRSISDSTPSATINHVFVPSTEIGAKDSSVLVGAQPEDSCGNGLREDSLFFHRTMDMNVGWIVKDSLNKLSWNPYVGFNESFDIEYEVYFTSSLSEPWVYEGSVGLNTSYEHKVPAGDKMYYYHVKAKTKDPSIPDSVASNSNIALVYTPYVDTVISLNENLLNQQLQLYPNPVKNQFVLEYSGNHLLEFRLLNQQGQEIKMQMHHEEQGYSFEVSSLASGMYFLLIRDETQQTSLKFFKE